MKKVAILATNGFEESELTSPLEAMKKEGFHVDIVSEKSGTIKAWAETDWGKDYDVDKTLGPAEQVGKKAQGFLEGIKKKSEN